MAPRTCSHDVSPMTTCPLCYPSRAKSVAKKAAAATAGTLARPYALRLYVDGEGTSQLLCDYAEEYGCPQWHWAVDKRMTWATPEEALTYLSDVAHARWPEFREKDVRVVRVVPPTPPRETYVEITDFGCPEPTASPTKKAT